MPFITDGCQRYLKRQLGAVSHTAEGAQGLFFHALLEATLNGNAVSRADAHH